MRRFVFLAAVVALAACGTPEPQVGETTIRFASPPPADSALSRVAVELAQLGFTIGGRKENLVFTAPQPLPGAAASGNTVTTQPGTAADSSARLWFIHVTADDRLFRGGSNTTVRAFFVPQTGILSPGNIVQENAQAVTSDHREAFRELRRIADRLHDAAHRR